MANLPPTEPLTNRIPHVPKLTMDLQRVVRVFISSTFKDLQLERNHLMRVTFPKIRAFCKKRQLEFIEIDLRWGITEEDSQQGRTIALCLREIDKSRPFFIGILGSRYGWIPSAENIAKNEEILSSFSWVHEDTKAELSITEMEIQYGVLRNPEMAGNACFYLKAESGEDSKSRDDKGQDLTDIDHISANKLCKLKKHLLTQKSFPVRIFNSLQDLDSLVQMDLEREINARYSEEKLSDQFSQDRIAHLSFLFHKTQIYVPDFEIYARLDAHVKDTCSPLIIIGDSGSGKSALLANWLLYYHKMHPDTFLFFHFCGGAPESTSYFNLIDRLVFELRAAFDISETFTLQAALESELEKESISNSKRDVIRYPEIAKNFLSEAINTIPSNHPWILVIDALDQLNPTNEAHLMEWLPLQFPSQVRVFLSCRTGIINDHLLERHYSQITLPLLTPERKKQLINVYLERFGKKLPLELLNDIISFSLTDSPLFLQIFLEELRSFGNHELLPKYINQLISPKDSKSFIDLILTQWEREYDLGIPNTIRKFLIILWANIDGISEHDLRTLLGVSNLHLAIILANIEPYLVYNNGLLNFAHIFFREAIEYRYLNTAIALKNAYILLGDVYNTANNNNQAKIFYENAKFQLLYNISDFDVDLCKCYHILWNINPFDVNIKIMNINRDLEIVVAKNPKQPKAALIYLVLGEFYQQLKSYSLAFQCNIHALEILSKSNSESFNDIYNQIYSLFVEFFLIIEDKSKLEYFSDILKKNRTVGFSVPKIEEDLKVLQGYKFKPIQGGEENLKIPFIDPMLLEDFTNNIKLKILVEGPVGSNKTSLIEQFIKSKSRLIMDYKLTVGVDILTKDIEYRYGHNVTLSIWDVGGNERFSFIRKTFYKGTDGVLLVFDLARESTWDSIKMYREEVRIRAGNIPVVIVGNNANMITSEELSKHREEYQKYALEDGSEYVETSINDYLHIYEAFLILTRRILSFIVQKNCK